MLGRFRQRWRHFSPRRRSSPHSRGEFCVNDCVTPSLEGDVYETAMQRVKRALQRRPEIQDLEKDISKLKAQVARTNVVSDWLALLFAQAPRSAVAQIEMDKHPHGYRNKHERLFELIDFNDTLVSAILTMDDDDISLFQARAKQGCDFVCGLVNAPRFTAEQWEAITRGLSREVAVYLAAKRSGFYAYMTSRQQDAMGIDMQVKDPESGAYINIDVKTPSAFRHRLEDLVDEERLNEHELVKADERSYAIEENGHGDQRAEVILLCILPDVFGEIENFRFTDDAPMRDMLSLLINRHGLRDNRYGRFGSLAQGDRL